MSWKKAKAWFQVHKTTTTLLSLVCLAAIIIPPSCVLTIKNSTKNDENNSSSTKFANSNDIKNFWNQATLTVQLPSDASALLNSAILEQPANLLSIGAIAQLLANLPTGTKGATVNGFNLPNNAKFYQLLALNTNDWHQVLDLTQAPLSFANSKARKGADVNTATLSIPSVSFFDSATQQFKQTPKIVIEGFQPVLNNIVTVNIGANALDIYNENAIPTSNLATNLPSYDNVLNPLTSTSSFANLPSSCFTIQDIVDYFAYLSKYPTNPNGGSITYYTSSSSKDNNAVKTWPFQNLTATQWANYLQTAQIEYNASGVNEEIVVANLQLPTSALAITAGANNNMQTSLVTMPNIKITGFNSNNAFSQSISLSNVQSNISSLNNVANISAFYSKTVQALWTNSNMLSYPYFWNQNIASTTNKNDTFWYWNLVAILANANGLVINNSYFVNQPQKSLEIAGHYYDVPGVYYAPVQNNTTNSNSKSKSSISNNTLVLTNSTPDSSTNLTSNTTNNEISVQNGLLYYKLAFWASMLYNANNSSVSSLFNQSNTTNGKPSTSANKQTTSSTLQKPTFTNLSSNSTSTSASSSSSSSKKNYNYAYIAQLSNSANEISYLNLVKPNINYTNNIDFGFDNNAELTINNIGQNFAENLMLYLPTFSSSSLSKADWTASLSNYMFNNVTFGSISVSFNQSLSTSNSGNNYVIYQNLNTLSTNYNTLYTQGFNANSPWIYDQLSWGVEGRVLPETSYDINNSYNFYWLLQRSGLAVNNLDFYNLGQWQISYTTTQAVNYYNNSTTSSSSTSSTSSNSSSSSSTSSNSTNSSSSSSTDSSKKSSTSSNKSTTSSINSSSSNKSSESSANNNEPNYGILSLNNLAVETNGNSYIVDVRFVGFKNFSDEYTLPTSKTPVYNFMQTYSSLVDYLNTNALLDETNWSTLLNGASVYTLNSSDNLYWNNTFNYLDSKGSALAILLAQAPQVKYDQAPEISPNTTLTFLGQNQDQTITARAKPTVYIYGFTSSVLTAPSLFPTNVNSSTWWSSLQTYFNQNVDVNVNNFTFHMLNNNDAINSENNWDHYLTKTNANKYITINSDSIYVKNISVSTTINQNQTLTWYYNPIVINANASNSNSSAATANSAK